MKQTVPGHSLIFTVDSSFSTTYRNAKSKNSQELNYKKQIVPWGVFLMSSGRLEIPDVGVLEWCRIFHFLIPWFIHAGIPAWEFHATTNSPFHRYKNFWLELHLCMHCLYTDSNVGYSSIYRHYIEHIRVMLNHRM